MISRRCTLIRSNREEYIAKQREVFDNAAAFYASPNFYAPEVKESLDHIASTTVRALGGGMSVAKILDVGTGAGGLIPHFIKQGVAQRAITGIDVSPRMLAQAKRIFPEATFAEVDFLEGSIASLLAPEEDATPGAKYDAVVLNACFANIGPDPAEILRRAVDLCRARGVVMVSHPYGSAFCRALASEDGLVAQTALPNRRELEKILEAVPDLALEVFEDGTPYVWKEGEKRGIYLAALRVQAEKLP